MRERRRTYKNADKAQMSINVFPSVYEMHKRGKWAHNAKNAQMAQIHKWRKNGFNVKRGVYKISERRKMCKWRKMHKWRKKHNKRASVSIRLLIKCANGAKSAKCAEIQTMCKLSNRHRCQTGFSVFLMND